MEDESSIKEITLSQKPCNVVCLENTSKFLLGTYQLIQVETHDYRDETGHFTPEELSSINFRAGKLLIVAGNDSLSSYGVDYDYDCTSGGGVFNLKVVPLGSYSYTVFAAHSNGTVGIYTIDFERESVIALERHIKISEFNVLLTTIDTFESGDQNKPLVVGDSDGRITLVNSSQHLKRLQVTEDKSSVWSVKKISISSQNDLVIVGAEDSSWYIYNVIWEKGDTRAYLIHRNSRDFAAGITSILAGPISTDAAGSNAIVVLGSYDESIRFYKLHMPLSFSELQPTLSVIRDTTISIPEGGIWRMKMTSGQRRYLLIAAMYAGSYALEIDLETCSFKVVTDTVAPSSKLNVSDGQKLASKPLDYGVDITNDNRIVCMVDFNNNLCTLRKVDLGS